MTAAAQIADEYVCSSEDASNTVLHYSRENLCAETANASPATSELVRPFLFCVAVPVTIRSVEDKGTVIVLTTYAYVKPTALETLNTKARMTIGMNLKRKHEIFKDWNRVTIKD